MLEPLKKWLCVATALAWAPPGNAQTAATAVDWGLSIRTRFESKQDFNFDSSSQDYFLTKTRLYFAFDGDSPNDFFVELQDARIAGESQTAAPPVNDAAIPNIFADELDIHQAFWGRELGSGYLRVGRQKLNLGDNRLLASLEWVNTARVHDGVRLSLGDPERRRIDAFATTLVPVSPESFNDHAKVGNRYMDSEFHGVFVTDRATLRDGQLEYWFLYRNNDDFGDETSTLGIRFIQNVWQWQPDLQLAYQSGSFDGDDRSAWMLHASLSRAFGNNELQLTYNYGSGDSSPVDGKHETFDNLYPLNHPYYGYMDLFSLQNLENIELIYRKRFANGVVFYASLNDFRLADTADAWYNAGLAPIRITDGNVSSQVGSGLDLSLQTPLFSDRMQLAIGISRFFASSYVRAFGLSEDALFYFASLSYATD